MRASTAAISIMVAMLGAVVSALPVSAQTQVVTTQPGFINVGMTTSIALSGLGVGTYTVVVQPPSGPSASLNYTVTAATQSPSAIFGNTSSGFKAAVSQPGTYNVFVEQAGKVLGSTSLYVTNKLNITLTMVQAGTCSPIGTTARGIKFIPLFFVSYASNGAPMTNSSFKPRVTFTLPGHTIGVAGEYAGPGKWVGVVAPNWNYTNIGPWIPSANATDGQGNSGTFVYSGVPYAFTPATLSATVQLVNAATGQPTSTFSNGQTIDIAANVRYQPWAVEPIPGFGGPLNSTRGGVVTAMIGSGPYNATAGTFGGKKPILTVHLSPGAGGGYTGAFNVNSSLFSPTASYGVVVTAADDAQPPNTGSASATLLPATAPAASTSTVTAPAQTVTTTTTTTTTTVPAWAYGVMVVLLIVGLGLGYVLRRPTPPATTAPKPAP